MELNIKTKMREELIDVTNLIERNLAIDYGVVHLFVPHATCGLTLNENADPNLPKDITNFLNGLVEKGGWMHDKIDDNADAHIKASIIGSSLMIPVAKKRLQLGTWQNVFLCEFDGPRERKMLLNFIPSRLE
jgi:secondary thiamine-phosphate synthase enzyme